MGPQVTEVTVNENIVSRQAIRTLRFKILARDDFTCQYCGRKAVEAELEVDHVQPRSQGGKTDWANLITSCIDCNQGKRDRLLSPQQVQKKRSTGVGPPLSSVDWHRRALEKGREFIVAQIAEDEIPGRKRHVKGKTFWRLIAQGGNMQRNVSYYCDHCLPGWAREPDSPYSVLS